MEMVINSNYGGFEIPEELSDIEYETDEELRTNPMLIEWIKNNKDKTDLSVVELPKEMTDYMINEYDGLEEVLYVVDGKIYSA